MIKRIARYVNSNFPTLCREFRDFCGGTCAKGLKLRYPIGLSGALDTKSVGALPTLSPFMGADGFGLSFVPLLGAPRLGRRLRTCNGRQVPMPTPNRVSQHDGQPRTIGAIK